MKIQERFEESGTWIDVIEGDKITSFLKRYAPLGKREEGRNYANDYLSLEEACERLNQELKNRECKD